MSPAVCVGVNVHEYINTLTQEDFLFPHRVRSAHHQRTRVERHQFEGGVGCEVDDLLLSGEGVLRAAVATGIYYIILKQI